MAMINGKTQLTGLIGWPVAHSFSPAMQNAALTALRLNWVYVPLPVPPSGVGEAVRGLSSLGFRGVNVTVPHKQSVMPFLDGITPAARAIGAVNTITVEQETGHLLGSNTDWRGFLSDLLAQDIEVRGRDCFVLGAGGSARAIVYGLNQAGGLVTLLARRVDQARSLAEDLGGKSVQNVRSLEELGAAAEAVDAPLIVNTTPLGMSPKENLSVWPDNVPLPNDSFVYDLVYNPAETRLMRQAKAAGCRASNGLGMLLHQGAASLTQWSGLEPDLAIMERALKVATGMV